MYIEKYLVKKLSSITGIPTQDIDRSKPLRELGIYAKAIEKILSDLEVVLGKSIPVTAAFDYPSIDDLVSYLCGEKHQKKGIEKINLDYEPIAVIGIGCRFPKGCDNPELFWKALVEGRDLVSEVPQNRWDARHLYEKDSAESEKLVTKYGGFIENIEMFDAAHFGISPKEAKSMDVQQRIALEVAWEALESACELGPSLAGSNTGVFMGAGGSDYTRRYFKNIEDIDFYCATGSYSSIVSNRISYVLGLRGPSLSIDTACSSSLVSIHLAAKSLNAYECDMAIAGGVNAIVSPEITIALSKAKMMALDGKCKAFDERANGYVRSEGCGVVILKRLKDAIKDCNNIICVIRGSSVNHVGRSNGLSAPSGTAQREVIEQALHFANVKPSEIDYVETHGTGTLVGDPIEIEALGSIMKEGRDKTNPLIIGTVKTNMGHTELAAGVAGLIKVALSLKNEIIPKHLHFNKLNSRISLDDIPAVLPLENKDWKGGNKKRLAGISSFGFGGVNAHIVVEEYKNLKILNEKCRNGNSVFMSSAKSLHSLEYLQKKYEEYFLNTSNKFHDVCYAANVGRKRFAKRFAIIARNNKEAAEILRQHRIGNTPRGFVEGIRKQNEERDVTFLFTGQGSQYSGMGKYLYENEEIFCKTLNECNQILEQYINTSIVDLICYRDDDELLCQTQYTQPALFAFEYSLAKQIQSWGVTPKIVIGHSIGEYVAACISGIFSLDDALKLVAARGRLIQELPKEGSMLAVNMSILQLKELLGEFNENVISVAAVNSPANIVLSGRKDDISIIKNMIDNKGEVCKLLHVSHAFHSYLLEPMIVKYREILETVKFYSPNIPIVSNVTGSFIDEKEICSSEYWCKHIIKGVQFKESIEKIAETGIKYFIEIGPHPVLTHFIKQILVDSEIICISTQNRNYREYAIHECIATLFAHGWDFDKPLYIGNKINFPTYPFQRKKYWFSEGVQNDLKVNCVEDTQKRILTPFCGSAFENRLSYSSKLFQDHKIYGNLIFSGAAMIMLISSAVQKRWAMSEFHIEDITIKKPLVIKEGECAIIQVYIDDNDIDGKYHCSLFSTIVPSNAAEKKMVPDTWTQHLDVNLFIGEYKKQGLFKKCTLANGSMVSGNDFYEFIKAAGMEYGDSFQVIKKIIYTDEYIYAEFSCAKNENSYIDAGILDACSQLLLLSNTSLKSAYVFLGIDRFYVKKSMTKDMYCITKVTNISNDQHEIEGNFQLFDVNGEVVLIAEGVHLIKAESLSFNVGILETEEVDEDGVILNYAWEKIQQIPLEHLEVRKTFISFVDQEDTGREFIHNVGLRGNRCICVYPSVAYHRVSQYEYYIRPEKKEDYYMLFRAIENDLSKIDAIIDFWPINMTNTIFGQAMNMDNQYYGYGAALYITQCLLDNAMNAFVNAKFWIVTKNAVSITSEGIGSNFEQASLWGLGRVISNESPEIFGGIIDIDKSDLISCDCIYSALLNKFHDSSFCAIRKNEVYAQKLNICKNRYNTANIFRMYQDGCYVVTGGNGGLGKLLIHWLVKNGVTKIAILSRSIESKITSSLPQNIICKHYSCDISDEHQVQLMLEKIDSELANIKGVFHLAGKIIDKPLIKQTWTDYIKVFKPKMLGLWNIYRVLINYNLDCFIVFSSIASMIGTKGQANYAATNAVIDAFAYWSMNYNIPVTSISWGLWDAQGMREQMNSHVQKYLFKQGIGTIKSETALSVMNKMIEQGIHHSGYANFDIEQYVNTVDDRFKNYYKDIGIVQIIDKSKDYPLIDINNTLYRVQKQVGIAIGIADYETIDVDENLLDLGLDSLIVLSLRNNLKKEFGIELPYKDFLECRTVKKLSLLISEIQRENLQPLSPTSYEIVEVAKNQTNNIADCNSVIEQIKQCIGEMVWIEDYQNIDIDENLLDIGLDSLVIIALRNKIKVKFDIEIPFKEFLECRTIRKLSNAVLNCIHISRGQVSEFISENEDQYISKNENNFEFPLTDVQYAYWIGRGNQLALGNVSCHLYFEAKVKNIDINRLNYAINRLIKRHDMLRATFLPNGKQKISAVIPEYQIKYTDGRNINDDYLKDLMVFSRNELSHAVHSDCQAPLFDIHAFQINDTIMQLHVSLDMLIADGYSFNILLRDLYSFYAGTEKQLPHLTYTFRDYILENKKIDKSSDDYQRALQYWDRKAAVLPAAPLLPLAVLPEEIISPKFERRKNFMPEQEWSKIKKVASENGLTVSSLLLAAFAYILRKWCNSDEFTIMITLFNRQQYNEQVNEIVGDFTSLIAFGIHIDSSKSFIENTKKLQADFWEDMEHSEISGIEVLRMKAKKCGDNSEVIPVVFTSVLSYSSLSNASNTTINIPDGLEAELMYSISQTPQVWMDFQIFENNGMLSYNWDTVQGLFFAGILDDMFAAYNVLLYGLAQNEHYWYDKNPVKIPKYQAERREKVNNTSKDFANILLHESFFRYAAKNPDKIAIIQDNTKLSYCELANQSIGVMLSLNHAGMKQGKIVGILLPKGTDQVAAVLGILSAGGAYLPLDISFPEGRIKDIINSGKVEYVITNVDYVEKISLNTIAILIENCLKVEVNKKLSFDQDTNDLAYVIYTSGSTGSPKGVMISHKSAMNTIQDVDERYNINENDSVLAISHLNFDLSVFDIFGILSRGGTVVFPAEDKQKDPAEWEQLVESYGVTIWNTVPAIMEMFITYISGKGVKVPKSIRLVLLSGDWISLDLSKKLIAEIPDADIVSLGGATEAAIWSIVYPIQKVEENWTSIPYGFPMTNQQFYILDSALEDCPEMVSGELYIGGLGVAIGYLNNEEENSQHFIKHHKTDKRLYRTGDFGRYCCDGSIEFLGRKDQQIKLRGHRIELGEIESILSKYYKVKGAMALVSQRTGDQQIIAFVSPKTYNETESQYNSPSNLWNELIGIINKDCEVDFVIKAEMFNKELDKVAINAVLSFLQGIEISEQRNRTFSIESIMASERIDSKYEQLIQLWVEALLKKKVIIPTDNKSFIVVEKVAEDKTEHKLQSQLHDCISTIMKRIPAIISGEREAFEIFYSENVDLNINPEELLALIPGTNYVYNKGVDCIYTLISRTPHIKILEIGCRTGKFAARILEHCTGYLANVEYTVSDSSLFFLDEARSRLSKYTNVNYELIDLDNLPLHNMNFADTYDLIIASNSLHRNKNIPDTLMKLHGYLKPEGMILIIENTINNSLQLITTAVAEQGFINISDNRKNGNGILLSRDEWIRALEDNNYMAQSIFCMDKEMGTSIIIAKSLLAKIDEKELRSYAEMYLPGYMIPNKFYILASFPLTSNGKIDRNLLRNYSTSNDCKKEQYLLPETETEILISNIWSKMFDKKTIGKEANFFELGGDSLLATVMISKIRDGVGIEVSLRDIFDKPNISQLSKYIDEEKNKDAFCKALPQIVPDKARRNHVFPLTEVQQAYWLGRSGVFELSDVSTHSYFEIEKKNLQVERLENAWNRLISYHDMMRVVIEGQKQVVLNHVGYYRLETIDLSAKTRDEAYDTLLTLRDEMSHQVLRLDIWPPFEIKIALYGDHQSRIMVSFDNLIFDGSSMLTLFDEWAKLYENPQMNLPPLNLTFRDYVLAKQNLEDTIQYREDKNYWLERVKNLPAAPELPILRNIVGQDMNRFSRLDMIIKKEYWDNMKIKAKKLSITPSALLLTAFSMILGRWSKSKHFTVNLTLFNRLAVHPEVNQIIGDFTSLTLLEIDMRKEDCFENYAKQLQKRLWLDLSHSIYGGVSVLRDYSRINGIVPGSAVMPVVFTSALGLGNDSQDGAGISKMGKLIYNITQTPQVWLDHQVYESNGDLIINWDYINYLFPYGIINEMFESYHLLLIELAKDLGRWNDLIKIPVPSHQLAARNLENEQMDIPKKLLHECFFEQAKILPENIAILSDRKSLTYKQLHDYSSNIAEELVKRGVKPNTLIAIVMEKGWEQIVGIISVLYSGAAYLPIDPTVPKERLDYLLNSGEVDVILTQTWLKDNIVWPDDIAVIDINNAYGSERAMNSCIIRQEIEDLAYVIFTSGTTGTPKGVMINHKGAINTIMDINRRIGMNQLDRVLALSNLNFDLSVYDVFGPLICGGAVVIPESDLTKDPQHWLDLLSRYQVTVWNSVPAFMQILVEKKQHLSLSLRTILLSGDWIPIHLPRIIKNQSSDKIKIFSLGGATEASIWSIYYPINEVDKNWKSIPYGYSLCNQSVKILNEQFEEQPDYVIGQIYIGGVGLAKGYWKDEKKTKESFVTDPYTHERLYRTGDLGRYIGNGIIEILGREDSQVKIRGYRIELGEISAIVNSCSGVIQSTVLVLGDNTDQWLSVFAVIEKGSLIDADRLKQILKEKLPKYMLPQQIQIVDQIPLTPNGKIDRNKLEQMNKMHDTSAICNSSNLTNSQKHLGEILEKIIGVSYIGLKENFFDMGANSLHIMRLQDQIEKEFDILVDIVTLFEHTTLESLDTFLNKRLTKNTTSTAKTINKSKRIRNIHKRIY